MISFQKISILIIVFVLAFNLSEGYTQKGEFIDGLVILLTGDTIQKKILRFHNDPNGHKSCEKLITKDGNLKLRYRPKDTKAYIRDEEVFETKIHPSLFLQKKFLRRIETGHVNLYRYDYKYCEWVIFFPATFHSYIYYVQKNGEQLKRVYEKNEIVLAFKKIFAEYFKDCPEVSEKIFNKAEGYRQGDL